MIKHFIISWSHQKVLIVFNCSGWCHLACNSYGWEYDLVYTPSWNKRKYCIHQNAHAFNVSLNWDWLSAVVDLRKLYIYVAAFCNIVYTVSIEQKNLCYNHCSAGISIIKSMLNRKWNKWMDCYIFSVFCYQFASIY